MTATRSGIPVWWIRGPSGTLILVGTIRELAPGTRWDHDKLVSALKASDRVMFPGMVTHSISLVDAWGLQAKARTMATLPRGHHLSSYVGAADFQRLKDLERRGVLQPGIEKRHPLQIIQELIQYSKGEQASRGFLTFRRIRPGDDPETLVRSVVKQNKLRLVQPLPQRSKAALRSALLTTPAEYLPCLRQTITLAQSGSHAFHARSQAWAAARVVEVLASPMEQAFRTCVPRSLRGASADELAGGVRNLPNTPGTTLAVIDLSALASSGGVLDQLVGAGFQVRGPSWR